MIAAKQRLCGVEGPHASRHYYRLRKVFSPAGNWFASKRHLRAPVLRQISPMRIHRFDQRNLLRPSPALQLLLTVDRPHDFVEAFPVDKSIYFVSCGEPLDLSFFVLHHTHIEVIRHSDAQGAGSARHNIDTIFMPSRENSLSRLHRLRRHRGPSTPQELRFANFLLRSG